jgi:hypothetical protein
MHRMPLTFESMRFSNFSSSSFDIASFFSRSESIFSVSNFPSPAASAITFSQQMARE